MELPTFDVRRCLLDNSVEYADDVTSSGSDSAVDNVERVDDEELLVVERCATSNSSEGEDRLKKDPTDDVSKISLRYNTSVMHVLCIHVRRAFH